MKLESQRNNVVWRMNANTSSNVMYAIYVLINKLVKIDSLLLHVSPKWCSHVLLTLCNH